MSKIARDYRMDGAELGLVRCTVGQPPATGQFRTSTAQAQGASTLVLPDEALASMDFAEGPHHQGQISRTTAAVHAVRADGTGLSKIQGCDAALIISTAESSSLDEGQFPPQAASRPSDGPLSVKKFPYGSLLLFLSYLLCAIMSRFVSKNIPLPGNNVPALRVIMSRPMSKNVPALLLYDRTGRSLAWTSN